MHRLLRGDDCMGAVLGLLLGVGLLLIWSSFWPTQPRPTARTSRLRPLLSSDAGALALGVSHALIEGPFDFVCIEDPHPFNSDRRRTPGSQPRLPLSTPSGPP